MRSRISAALTLTAALSTVGCGSEEEPSGSDPGSGGRPSSGGRASGTGGILNSGGTASPGGTSAGGASPGGASPGGASPGGTSAGGSTSPGGATGTAGASPGGATGTAGASPGGATGTAGASPGGATGTAGTTGTAGSAGSASSGECSLLQEGFSTTKGGTKGGEGGTVVTVKNQADLERYAGASEPHVIRVEGKITVSPKGKEINVSSNKTIIGVGTTGEIDQGGFRIDSSNVIIRNLTIGNTFQEGDWDGKQQDWDGIQMDTAHHVWIDHCDFHHIGDGIIDSRKDTTNLTVSWNILRDHNKAFGIGWTANVTAEITAHHNWIRNTSQRNASADNVLRAHFYNNYLEKIDLYGTWARGRTNMVLENCVFDAVNHPHILTNPDIPNAGGGTLIAIGNIVRDTCTGNKDSTGTTYGFFNPKDFYSYHLDSAEELPALLAKCAGPRPELGMP